jgi:mannose-6-phosphate isomerase
MFVGITNTPRDYAWGSTTAIADLLGRAPSGAPEAEYWLGTHPGSPSLLASDGSSLASITTLPFLLKVLAAASPLSLQAHPNPAQAAEGFARENAAGVPLDAPFRNYKDDHHKPELIYALSPTFEALCGFRSVDATRALIASLGPDSLVDSFLDRLVDDASLPAVFEWLLSGAEDVAALVTRVVALAAAHPKTKEFATVGALAEVYPGDPGILISLLLNRVTLSRGEVLYLPAGNIHAYLSGLGIELMAASDNVLRGGLTPKYVDVPELLSVLDFTPLPIPILAPSHPSAGVSVFRPDVPDFELVVVSPPRVAAADPAVPPAENEGWSAEYSPESDSIVLCTSGFLHILGTNGSFEVQRGAAVYITKDESPLRFEGPGTVFMATERRSDR